METKEKNSEQFSVFSIHDWLGWLTHSPETIIVIFGCCLSASLACYSILSNDKFYERCEVPLELAASASSIEIAQEQLSKTIDGCKDYENQATKGFWQKNFEQQAKNLQLRQTATSQEQYFTLNQFRESIKNAKESICNNRKF